MITIEDCTKGKIGASKLHHLRTEGLREYGLRELEIRLPIKKEDIQEYLKKLIKRSLDGAPMMDGETIWGIDRSPIFIFDSPEQTAGNSCLRAIIPDLAEQYPWDSRCDSEYKDQISFQTDKTFYVMTKDISPIEELGGDILLVPDFRKRKEGYIAPIQYIVNNELFCTGILSLHRSLNEYVGHLRGLIGLTDTTIICKDTDYLDPINKHFKSYKDQYIK